MNKHSNERLEQLDTALRIAISDDKLTSAMIVNRINDTLVSLAMDLRARAAKANNVADAITVKDGSDLLGSLGENDYIVRPQEDDAYDPWKMYGAAQPVPLFGGAGQDTISFSLNSSSLSSDTITF